MLRILMLLFPIALSAQLVIKHQGQMADIYVTIGPQPPDIVDVDGDGVDEVNMGHVSGGSGFLNVITGESYFLPAFPVYWDQSQGSDAVAVGKARSNQQAEFATFHEHSWDNLEIFDIATGEIIFTWQNEGGIQRVLKRDYDGDGLDDYFVFYPLAVGPNPACYDYIIIGSGSAYIPSVGPTLDIQAIGPDMHLQWESVAAADGYRVLWGADPDSPCFTQVGYTQSTSFLHTGFGDVPRGFYKVIAVTANGVPRGTVGESAINSLAK